MARHSLRSGMNKSRLEAFSDGVLAVIITIMVLEMKPPHGASVQALRPVVPIFLSYTLSFVYIAIYWNNHHHLLHATQRVNGVTLWANLHLLFWLSIVPFTTAWMDENHFQAWPVAVYGMVLLMAGVAYSILTKTLLHLHGAIQLWPLPLEATGRVSSRCLCMRQRFRWLS